MEFSCKPHIVSRDNNNSTSASFEVAYIIGSLKSLSNFSTFADAKCVVINLLLKAMLGKQLREYMTKYINGEAEVK